MNSNQTIPEEDVQSSKILDGKESNLNVLYVWPGEWDLPSLDPECLIAMVN